MTTTLEDLQALVAQSILSTEAFKAQLAASQEAADRRMESAAEDTRQLKLSTEAFKAQMAASQEAADRRMEAAAEDSRRLKQRIDDLGKQMGGLGNKFGYFTEGLLLPSVETMLRERFGVTNFSTRVKTRRGEEWQELDGFGFVNGEKNIGFVVEVKSILEKRSIEQTLKQIRLFGEFHPEYKGMTLYGVIAAVDVVSKAQQEAVFASGLYLVTVNDDVAEFAALPQGFMPFASVV